MADLGYKINVQLPDEPHPGVLIILSGNETVKALLMAINKKVRKLFKRGYKCQYVTNKEGSVLDPEFTLLSALEREDTVAAHQHKLKSLGEAVGAKGSKKRTAQAAGIASAAASAPAAAAAAAGSNDSSDDGDSSSDDDDDDDFEDKEAAAAKKAPVGPGPKPAPPPAATPEPAAKKLKKEKKVRDPNMPKRAPNHFMLFMEKNRALIVGEGFTGKHVMSEASRRWTELPPSEKTPFTEKAKQLKDVYDANMLAYKAGKGGDSDSTGGSGAAVLVAAARAAAAAAVAESASPRFVAVAAPPPPEPEPEPEPTPQSAPPSAPSTPAVTTRKAKGGAKSKCDYKVLKRVLKQNAGAAVPEFLGAVLAGYNAAKAEAKSSNWLVTKMTGDKMAGFVTSQLSADHRAAIQK